MNNDERAKKELAHEIDHVETKIREAQERLDFLKKRLENLDKPKQKFAITFRKVVEARTAEEALELMAVGTNTGDNEYVMYIEDHVDTKILEWVVDGEVERELQPGEIE